MLSKRHVANEGPFSRPFILWRLFNTARRLWLPPQLEKIEIFDGAIEAA